MHPTQFKQTSISPKLSLEDITDYDIHDEISHLMEIKVKPRGFSSFKKFKQHRDTRIKELMFKLRSFFLPSGKLIKKSNGKTYKVMDDGSIVRFDPELDQWNQAKIKKLAADLSSAEL